VSLLPSLFSLSPAEKKRQSDAENAEDDDKDMTNENEDADKNTAEDSDDDVEEKEVRQEKSGRRWTTI
jgi:hypothetical protein